MDNEPNLKENVEMLLTPDGKGRQKKRKAIIDLLSPKLSDDKREELINYILDYRK